MTEQERINQIEWFVDLWDCVNDGEKQSALDAIEAAIKLLRKTPAEIF